MALRALVFSSDGSTTSALCHVLTELGIEAEICSEMLVAVERITTQPYNALLVDWDQQAEAIFLLKQMRELKRANQLLTLALVQNDGDLPQALQSGANSVIRKPVDTQQAHDTLTTAKQLILARQEPRPVEPQPVTPPVEPATDVATAAPSSNTPAEGGFAIDNPSQASEGEQDPTIKRGFLPQTATRSAVEAEQSIAHAEPPAPEPPPAPRQPDPAIREKALSILGYGPKADADGAGEAAASETSASEAAAATARPAWQRPPRDLHREFSSVPEESASSEEPEVPGRKSSALLYAVTALAIVTAFFWVFAPGNASFVRLKNLSLARLEAIPAQVPTRTAESRPVSHPAVAKSEEPILPDPAITEQQDEASSNIRIIENKPIPIAGAQQPPTSDAPPGSQPVISPAPSNGTASNPVPAVPSATGPAAATPTPAGGPADSSASTPHPQLQPAVVTQISSSSAPPAPVATPIPPVSRSENSSTPDVSDAHVPVIIPDSLRNSPSASSINSVELPVVPEETSRAMLLKQVDPDYPSIAVGQRLEGTVILQTIVGSDGTVRDTKLMKGYFVLGKAAFEAVRQWRFKPYLQNGKPSDFQTYITLIFKLPS